MSKLLEELRRLLHFVGKELERSVDNAMKKIEKDLRHYLHSQA